MIDGTTLSREELHDLVWAEPTRTVATRLGLSDRGLAKICLRLHVPVPGRGHWQKKAAGKEVRRPQLRPLADSVPPNERQVVIDHRHGRLRDASVVAAAGQQAALESATDRIIKVSSTLDQPHPIVERTARSLRRARRDHRGVLIPEAQRILDIRVTRGALERALLVADALLKAFDERKYLVTCAPEGERRTTVRLMDEDVAFAIEERVRRVEKEPEKPKQRSARSFLTNSYSLPPLPQYEWIATGQLAIKLTDQDFVGSRRTWQDTAHRTIETQLNRFIVGLVATAEAKKVERKRREEREREWVERRREDEERQRLRFEEERRQRLLAADLELRTKSREVREYVEAVREAASRRDVSETQRNELAAWLGWAAGYADRLDPALRDAPPRDSWSFAP